MTHTHRAGQDEPMQATPAQPALWQRLQACRFGRNDSALPAVVQRVARQSRGQVSQAQQLVGESRQCCVLACTDTHDGTPTTHPLRRGRRCIEWRGPMSACSGCLRCARAAPGADGTRAAHALVVAGHCAGHAGAMDGPRAARDVEAGRGTAVLIAGALLTVGLRLRTRVRIVEWT